MRHLGFGAVAALALCALAVQPALAKSHTGTARELTLVRLNQEVLQQCGGLKQFTQYARCREMKSLLADLYKNPQVASQKDLDILNRLAELGTEVVGAQADLMAAIEDTKKIYIHVVRDHGGIWENHQCGPIPLESS